MSFYLDTSFLISGVADEEKSAIARAWLKSGTDPTVIADFATLEFDASVSRFVRTGRVTQDVARVMLARLDQMRASSATHVHTRNDYERASTLIRDFTTKLAAPDALHLASAINLGATLVTFDRRLAEAAQARGAKVLTPE